MRKLLSIFFATLLCGASAWAQGELGPSAGKFSLSMQLGRGESFGSLSSYYTIAQPLNGGSYYTMSAPFASTVSSSSNSLVNMIGAECKYFFSDQLALRVSGMGIIDLTPAQDGTDAVNNTTTDPATVVPGYNAIESKKTSAYTGSLGADFYLPVSARRVHPYVGVMATGYYGRSEFFWTDRYNGNLELGPRYFETYALGGSIPLGVDCYVTDGMFLGIEFKAVSYIYSVNKLMPMAGMEAYDADNHNVGFFSCPMVKIGFSF